jgi:hypothetical protein
MFKKIAAVFGIVFLVAGLLGFVPSIAPNEHMMGLHVNSAHNLVHILTGIVALIVAMKSDRASVLFFRVFGVIYGLVAILGFMMGDRPLLGIISNNIPDAWFHTIVALFSLVVGFSKKLVNESTKSRNMTGAAGSHA